MAAWPMPQFWTVASMEVTETLEAFMALAWSEIRRAPLRFALLAGIVALVSMLVSFLSALTAGLGAESVSAVANLPGDRVVLSGPASVEVTFNESALTAAQVDTWANADGVTDTAALDVVVVPASAGGTAQSVAVFALPAGVGATPTDGTVSLSDAAMEDLGVDQGDRVMIAGHEWTVGEPAGHASHGHMPVVFVPRDAAASSGMLHAEPSALLVWGAPEWNTIGDLSDTAALSTVESMLAVPSFKGEVGSLTLIIGMLVVISAVVTGAFFMVWTTQRTPALTILRALGVPRQRLKRDAMSQAAIVVTIGTVGGVALAVGGIALAGAALPVVVSPWTIALPAVIVALLALAGSALATRSVTRVNPLNALGALS
ncbi:ABC transporter permease [Demequina sp. B12]|uniref:ABC transporter permease n=1 Tax=Demequina sp. B12 TaxID=2992757 RepID=UPI00237AC534|nr:ABC transporter permease [Demequina sp. B12]MDE0572209.1 ABC transporter permease [Demequina sp. B12]